MLRERKVTEQNYIHDLATPNLHVRLLCSAFGSSVIMDLCPVCLEAGVEPCTERGRLYNPSCIGQFLALHEQIIKKNIRFHFGRCWLDRCHLQASGRDIWALGLEALEAFALR